MKAEMDANGVSHRQAGLRSGGMREQHPTTTTGTQQNRPPPVEQLKESLRNLLATLLDRAFGLALDKVESLAAYLDDMAARGGLKLNAVLGGARAAIAGRSPVWGAIRGAVSALSPAAKAALIIGLVLALLLLPVTVVLVLLLLITIAVIAVARSASTSS